jgi:hypothetical protein
MEWVESNLGVARALVAAYTGREQEALPNVELLDEVYAAWRAEWLRQPSGERDDPNVYINAIGLAFGQALVDELGLQWAVVTDDYGTEIAVHGQPGDVLVFPPNLVAKRFETGETGFLAPVFNEIVDRVRSL